MSDFSPTRRQTLAALGTALAAAAALPVQAAAQAAAPEATPAFSFCLNTSTIRGQQLGFRKELEIASKAGYNGVEIWIDPLQKYVSAGSSTGEVRRMLADLNLKVEDAIGFAQWIVDDEAVRSKALDQLKREMELLAEIGCKRVAAPAMGATQGTALELKKIADRYRTILDLGEQTGVMPQLELWGFSKNLSRLSEVMYIAVESGHPGARLLLDVYHLYKGGSDLRTLPLVGKPAIEVFHMNDYPTAPPRETIGDADRVFPGDGTAPIASILNTLRTPGKQIVLSLELFNKTYYAQDALQVAKTGLAKMKALASVKS
ncbi:sugar phosphate isomerase/epimerase family protein [Tellurirhabdus rosea]|uniref:sugar phosphate isomerase/epimerase family protein n=1 Tax=Tellurirhabdus rosea TaxID=2674997 RepID=UPI00224ED22A|nr:sugar phosphate isomerase/epimerase family protein [Tellurirhabdus rosea]